MKSICSALRPLVVAVACVVISGCADTSPRQPEMDYRSAPATTTQGANSKPGGQRLIIQSGEGERLNLPWFVRDAQDWVNSN